MFGFWNVNKPSGPTSHDIVARLRRQLPKKTKIGHAGTLDPFAEGVLVICLGPAARLAEYLQRQPKSYEVDVVFGATSDTDDPTGVITPLAGGTAAPGCAEEAPAGADSCGTAAPGCAEEAPAGADSCGTAAPGCAPPTREQVEKALPAFVGEIMQVPPSHSAVHVDGRRAYKLARRGEAPDLPARPVTIHGITLLEYDYPRLRLAVTCGSGTYIRSLARDLGRALGVGGYCGRLVRTAVGPFTLADAADPESFNMRTPVASPLLALPDMLRATVTAPQQAEISLGRAVSVASLAPGPITPGRCGHAVAPLAPGPCGRGLPAESPAPDAAPAPAPHPTEGSAAPEVAVLNEAGEILCIASAVALRDGRWRILPAKVFIARP